MKKREKGFYVGFNKSEYRALGNTDIVRLKSKSEKKDWEWKFETLDGPFNTFEQAIKKSKMLSKKNPLEIRWFIMGESETGSNRFYNRGADSWRKDPAEATKFGNKSDAIESLKNRTGETVLKTSIVRGIDDGKAWNIEL